VTSPGAGSPTGQVVFTGNAGEICSSSLNGESPDQATCTTAYPARTKDTVTAAYQGSTDFTGSQSNSVTETVGAVGTHTSVTSSANPSVPGQDITFTVTVTANAPSTALPTGRVAFLVAGAGRGFACVGGSSVTLSNGTASCTLRTAPTAEYSPLFVIVGYEGSRSFNASATSLLQVVNRAPTAIALTSSNPAAKAGQSVTFTAALSVPAPASGTPTGTVTFTFSPAGKYSCVARGANVDLSGGTAKCRLAAAALKASVNVTATYDGSTSFLPSNQSLNQAVSG
jgi:hypothetical protein